MLVVAVVVLAVVLAGVWTTREAGSSGGGAELEHVHGLGVDPQSGDLYVGSHYGLFHADGDGGSLGGPVGGHVQDFMGFTVAGPGRFLASGHPGEDQGGPSSVGLIESTDGGRTWTSLSLAGEADFHALEYRHGSVYGLNAMTGELMVSEDLENWETRSRPAAADFAVSPVDPDVLVATTAEGPVVSRDGGRTFDVIDGAPLLLLVSWADDGALVGLDPTGTVYVSNDADTFEKVGALGAEPEALHAAGGGTVFASASGGLWRSGDGGRTFERFPAAQ